MYNNSWIHWSSEQQHRGSLIRDQFIRDSLLAMGQEDAGRGTYVHIYLNRALLGRLQCSRASRFQSHYAEYHGGDADDYDARNGSSVVDGTSTSYNRNAAHCGKCRRLDRSRSRFGMSIILSTGRWPRPTEGTRILNSMEIGVRPVVADVTANGESTPGTANAF